MIKYMNKFFADGNKALMAIWGRAAWASIGLSNISERVPNLDDMRTLWSFYCVFCNRFNLVRLSLLRHVQTPHLQQTSEGTVSISYTSKLGSLSFWISFGVCVHSPYHTRSGWLGEHVEEQCLSVWELSHNSERRGNSCCSHCRMLSWVFLILQCFTWCWCGNHAHRCVPKWEAFKNMWGIQNM